jgi:hypothetical protein
MPILFACQCGKALQAREDFAGRRMKCPACEQVITIPSAPDRPPPAPTPPVLPVRKPASDLFAAGTITPRGEPPLPAAPEPVVSPPVKPLFKLAPEKGAATPGRAARRREADVWSDGFLSQSITPWPKEDQKRVGAVEQRQRTGRGWLPWILLVLVLVAAVAAAVFYWPAIEQLLTSSRR